MRRLMNEPAEMDTILPSGLEKARAIAEPILAETKRLVGFWTPGKDNYRRQDQGSTVVVAPG